MQRGFAGVEHSDAPGAVLVAGGGNARTEPRAGQPAGQRCSRHPRGAHRGEHRPGGDHGRRRADHERHQRGDRHGEHREAPKNHWFLVLVGEHLVDPRGTLRIVVCAEQRARRPKHRCLLGTAATRCRRFPRADAHRLEGDHHWYVTRIGRQVDIVGEVDHRTSASTARPTRHPCRDAQPARRDQGDHPQHRLAEQRGATRGRGLVPQLRRSAVRHVEGGERAESDAGGDVLTVDLHRPLLVERNGEGDHASRNLAGCRTVLQGSTEHSGGVAEVTADELGRPGDGGRIRELPR